MKLNGKIFIIVVGDGGRSVEILDTSLPGNGWKLGMLIKNKHDLGKLNILELYIFHFTGPSRPEKFYGCMLVTSPTKKGVVLSGGYSFVQNNGIREQSYSNLLYELSGDSEENLTWSLLDQKLSVARSSHVSFSIPNHCVPSHL